MVFCCPEKEIYHYGCVSCFGGYYSVFSVKIMIIISPRKFAQSRVGNLFEHPPHHLVPVTTLIIIIIVTIITKTIITIIIVTIITSTIVTMMIT